MQEAETYKEALYEVGWLIALAGHTQTIPMQDVIQPLDVEAQYRSLSDQHAPNTNTGITVLLPRLLAVSYMQMLADGMNLIGDAFAHVALQHKMLVP